MCALRGEHHRRIGKQLPPAFRGTEGGSDGNGGVPTTSAALDGVDYSRLGKASLTDDPGLGSFGGLADLVSEVHTLNGKPCLYQVKSDLLSGGKEKFYPSGMADARTPDPWPQRSRFRELVDRWVDARTEKTKTERREIMAVELGIGRESLKQYYSGKVIPGRDLIQRIAGVLSCSVSDLMDDPGGAPEGFEAREWSEFSESERMMVRRMFEDLRELSGERRKGYFEAWRHAMAMVKAFDLGDEGKK